MSVTLDIGQVLAARYELRRRLGRGPGGETWLALDQVTSREVVLKFAPGGESGADRLQRERAVLAATSHPAVLSAERVSPADGPAFLVSDYLPGGDLSRLRGQTWPFILRRVVPVAEALGALHAAGYVHGDVKSTNVLLDADGLPHLADLGSARPIGAVEAGPGSPYAMSPQRYAHEPAAVADDVYAVGAMLHELISGHPPFYPEISAERVRSEPPPALVGRPPVPTELRDLVASCLAKSAADRPPAMAALAKSLRACLELPAAVEAPGPVTATALRPPAEPAPIRPQWSRATQAGPSARELQREGFRRGVLASAFALAFVAAGFVFFVLPGLVGPTEGPRPTPAPPAGATAPAPPPAPPVDLVALAELRRQAEALRGLLAERLGALEQHDVATWGAAGRATTRGNLAQADAAIAAHRYDAAVASLQAAAAGIATLEKQRIEVLRALLHEGGVALDAGRSLEAKDKFTAALRVDAASAAAQTGLKRAQVLDVVLQETASGERFERSGDARSATAAYQRALALDPAAPRAREGLARLQSRAGRDAFATAMAQGMAALARQDYAAAKAAFEGAGRLRPGAPEVAEGLRQVEQATRTREIAAMLARARAAEREERWSDALGGYREALKVDATLLEGQQGVERCEPRAMLDAELQSFIDHTERLFTVDGRGAARGVLDRAAHVAGPGPRLAGQMDRLQQLLQLAETPIRVALSSDNATDVQIYRVGKLGPFERREVELLPGRYTVVGTRSGYRDVRKELNLMPGATPPALVVRCEEPI